MILRRKDSKGPADKYFDNWKDYDEKKIYKLNQVIRRVVIKNFDKKDANQKLLMIYNLFRWWTTLQGRVKANRSNADGGLGLNL